MKGSSYAKWMIAGKSIRVLWQRCFVVLHCLYDRRRYQESVAKQTKQKAQKLPRTQMLINFEAVPNLIFETSRRCWPTTRGPRRQSTMIQIKTIFCCFDNIESFFTAAIELVGYLANTFIAWLSLKQKEGKVWQPISCMRSPRIHSSKTTEGQY